MHARTLKRAASKLAKVVPHVLRRGFTFGFCPICDTSAVFIKEGDWLRDDLRCLRCWSIPRNRALMMVLEKFFPKWREVELHESSPGGPSSDKLARECQRYCPTHWYPDIAPGEFKGSFRCENLEAQTFPDASFDLIVTQDVFEHILEPANAFREIFRTLKPGGAHVFTVPWYYWKNTVVRASQGVDGVRFLMAPEYHGNPIDTAGSLVVTEWGGDFCDAIFEHSGMTTTVIHISDAKRGVAGQFVEVFVSRRPQDRKEMRHPNEKHCLV